MRWEANTQEIILRFGRGVQLVWVDGQLLPARENTSFYDKVNQYQGRLFQSFPRMTRRLEATKSGDGLGLDLHPSLAFFARVRLQEDPSKIEQIVDEFESDPAVDEATLSLGFQTLGQSADDGGTDGPDDASESVECPTKQVYLGPSGGDTNGVDARHAWRVPGGAGDRIRVCVVDRSAENHEDLPKFISATDSLELGSAATHGTRTMGVIGAIRDDKGVSGIAYRVSTLLFSNKTYVPNSYDEDGSTWAIDRALGLVRTENSDFVPLVEGEIILLQWQTYDGFMPIELESDIRDAIQVAKNKFGVITVSAAGNAGDPLPQDLSDDDSGSIIVGAGDWRTGERVARSNYGSRVNCQGWGNCVGTVISEYTNVERSRSYTWKDFYDTSSAAAMIAGVAAVVQGTHRAVTATPEHPFGVPISPTNMRDVVARYGVGPQGSSIGKLPDLKEICQNVLRTFLPLTYVRDGAPDTEGSPVFGTPVYGPFHYISPDIIVKRKPEDEVLPAGSSPSTDDLSVSDPVIAGETYVIYVRVHNRSSVAHSVAAELYWGSPATYHRLGDWNPLLPESILKSTSPVKPGKYQLLAPCIWTAPAGSDGAHFMAIVEPHELQDLPDSYYTSLAFHRTIDETRYRQLRMRLYSYRYRNVQNIFVYGAGTAVIEFDVNGLELEDATMTLRIDCDLPDGRDVTLQWSGFGLNYETVRNKVLRSIDDTIVTRNWREFWDPLEEGFGSFVMENLAIAAGGTVTFKVSTPWGGLGLAGVGSVFRLTASQYRINQADRPELLGRSHAIVTGVQVPIAVNLDDLNPGPIIGIPPSDG